MIDFAAIEEIAAGCESLYRTASVFERGKGGVDESTAKESCAVSKQYIETVLRLKV